MASSTAPKKRRSKYLSQFDVTGVASIFFFFVFMFLGLIGVPDIPRSISVDSSVSTHALCQPNALKEDTIDIVVTRDGQIYFCNTKMLLEDLPERIEQKVRTGSERKAYLRADASAQYGDIEVVIQQVRLSGINQVVVVTEQCDPLLPL